MCGRFTLARQAVEVAEAFGLAEAPEWRPRYNVAPTQAVFVVRLLEGRRAGSLLRWGLIPPWAASPKDGPPLINARSETAAEKPAFRSAFAKRRCLVPADGFFEWKGGGAKKVPHYFTAGGLFAMAGLWESWRGPSGVVESVAVLTTQANDLVRECHDRMPVIVPPSSYAAWLAGGDAGGLLRPFPASEMSVRAVSGVVGCVRNEGPDCIAPPGPRQAMLF
jgi:putative SOS response-associated peptidase YedK